MENSFSAVEQLTQHAGEDPPFPIRGPSKNEDGTGEEQDEGVKQQSNEKLNIRDLMPHVDLHSHITGGLLSELADRNWEVRNEALQKLTNIVTENKLVTKNLGKLPNVLAQRIVDSSSKIVAAAIAICQSLGSAMGMQCKQHVHTLFPGMLQGMGNSKIEV